MNSAIFEFFVILAILANSTLLCLNGVLDDDLLEKFNLVFTQLFLVEMLVKMTGLGISGYFRDKINVLDSTILILSELELYIIA